MNTNEFERFQRKVEERLREIVSEMWNITTELNGNGELIERAVMKDKPKEVIKGELGVYQMNLN